MLVAMDAMGYDAFHIGALDPLYSQPAIVQRLRSVIHTALAAGPWSGLVRRKGVVMGFAGNAEVRPAAPEPLDVMFVLQLSHSEQVAFEMDGQTRLLKLDAGWVEHRPCLGRLDFTLYPQAPFLELANRALVTLPETLLPDPSMLGIIDFVESEARAAQQKRG
jgi:hypothetical protein